MIIKYDKSGTQKKASYLNIIRFKHDRQKWEIHCNFAREKGFSLKAGSEGVSANSGVVCRILDILQLINVHT